MIKNKRGQMILWAILALILILAIFFIYIMKKKEIEPARNEANPYNKIKSCIREATKEAENKIIWSGGFENPGFYKEYNGSKATYLCFNANSFETCIQQYPMYLEEVRKEIYRLIAPEIENCFQEQKRLLEEKEYVVEMGEMNLNVELTSDFIRVEIKRPMKITKRDSTSSLEDFSLYVDSSLFNLAMIARDIADHEAKYCYFEYVGYMLTYPRYDIKKFTFSEGTKIYRIKDLWTKKEMNIAVRGCVTYNKQI